MSQGSAPSIPINARPQSPESATAVLLWLGAQLAALALSASRVTLWARMPAAGEQLALIVLLVTQIGAAALLFPALLQNFRCAAIALITGWPMAELASFLADAGMARLIAGEAYVSAWLIALYLWQREIRGPWPQVYAAAVAGIVSLGGPVLWYLHAEFSQNDVRLDWARQAFWGPAMGAISQIIPDHPAGGAWKMMAALWIGGTLMGAWGYFRQRIARGQIKKTRSPHD